LKLAASFFVAASAVVVSGCCAFAPCHPSMTVAGRVTSISGEPVPAAHIRLHGMTGTSNKEGCFRLSGADALPFELVVEAAGFKPLTAEAKSGIFQITVELAPQDSSKASAVHWEKSRVVPPAAVPGCT
jgi:hypothetical protein